MIGGFWARISLEPLGCSGLVAGCRFVLPLKLLGHCVSCLFPIGRHLVHRSGSHEDLVVRLEVGPI